MTLALLTSTGITPTQTMVRFMTLKANLGLKTCGLIYNAASSPNSKYVTLARQQLEGADLHVTMIDANTITHGTYDMIYIAGGNTFTLMNDIRQGIGMSGLKDMILSSKLVVGVSAGAVILTSTIRIVSEIQADENPKQLDEYTALGLLNYEFLPHYSKALENEVKTYQNKYHTKVTTCANDEFVEVSL